MQPPCRISDTQRSSDGRNEEAISAEIASVNHASVLPTLEIVIQLLRVYTVSGNITLLRFLEANPTAPRLFRLCGTRPPDLGELFPPVHWQPRLHRHHSCVSLVPVTMIPRQTFAASFRASLAKLCNIRHVGSPLMLRSDLAQAVHAPNAPVPQPPAPLTVRPGWLVARV